MGLRILLLISFIFLIFRDSHAAPPFTPSVIYGNDDRIDYFEITDPAFKKLAASAVALFNSEDLVTYGSKVLFPGETYQQYANLCSDQPFLTQPTAAMCSGALVGPNRVLTAGHCVRTDEQCLSLSVAFDYQLDGPNQRLEYLSRDSVYSCKRIIARKFYRDGIDYALIELDRMVPDRTPIPVNYNDGLAIGTELTILGFPAGLPLKLTGHAVVRNLKSGFFVTNADTFVGNSGSPVINPKTFAVEGVLVRGELDFEHDASRLCNIERHCTDTGCRGESATLASALKKPMQWNRTQPMLEEATGFAHVANGAGQALVRIPFETSTHQFTLRLEVYSMETRSYEIVRTVNVAPSPFEEQIKIEGETFSLPPSDLVFGAIKSRLVLLMDGSEKDTDPMSIVAMNP